MMLISKIICWCNENQGFLSFLQGISSAVLSIVATVIAIKAMKYPYRNHIIVTSTTEGEYEDFVAVNVFIGNAGPGPLAISSVEVGSKSLKVFGRAHIDGDNDLPLHYIKAGETVSELVKINGINTYNARNFNKKFRIYIESADNKKLTFKRCFYQ